MLLLVDASLSPQAAEWLRRQQQDALHVVDIGLQNETDAVIFARAAADHRTILTADADFAALAAAQGTTETGVVLFRLNSLRVNRLVTRIEEAWAEIQTHLPGAIVTVEDARVRARRLPVSS